MKLSPSIIVSAISAIVLMFAAVLAAPVVFSNHFPVDHSWTRAGGDLNNTGSGIIVAAGSPSDNNKTPLTPTSVTSENTGLLSPEALDVPTDAIYIALNDTSVQDELARWGNFKVSGITYQPDQSGAGNFTVVSFAPGNGKANQSVTALVDSQSNTVVEVRHNNNGAPGNNSTDNGHGQGQGQEKVKENSNGSGQGKDTGSDPATGNGNGNGNGNGKPKATDKPNNK